MFFTSGAIVTVYPQYKNTYLRGVLHVSKYRKVLVWGREKRSEQTGGGR